MHIEDLRDYCLSLKGVTEAFPFDEQTLVFKVMGKMFLLTDVDDFKSINVKCDPGKAIELREQYLSVLPGYHMSKKHWNTVLINLEITDSLLREWIRESYELVISGLSKRLQEELRSIE